MINIAHIDEEWEARQLASLLQRGDWHNHWRLQNYIYRRNIWESQLEKDPTYGTLCPEADFLPKA